MKVIIAGSRDVTDYEEVRQAVIDSGVWKLYGNAIEIVSGGARGVDRLGEEFAKRNGLAIYKFIPDWSKHGKKAGMLRNIDMGMFSDMLVAVWDGESRGTGQMIDWARKNGLIVHVRIVK